MPLTAAITEAVEARTELVAVAPEPEPEPEPEPAPPADDTVDAGVWDRVAQCESGGNWQINTGNGFYGGLQFELRSWQWVGGKGYPHENSKAEQIRRAEILLERQGWVAWPACSKKLGLR
ncbi:MAG: transglycosylase family protein [Actinobacteria bacterium]|nr:transglycosylase family protein [Actinomycetota bacterium]